VFPSDLPGVNPATLNGMLLYYLLMTKWNGLGDSTELSRVGLSQLASLAQAWIDILKVNQVLLPLANRFVKMQVSNRLRRAWVFSQLNT
jgi:hypothetical protein